jgi:hypothetical protein
MDSDADSDFGKTDRAYYIAGMVVVAQALGMPPIAAQIEIEREDSIESLLYPGAMGFLNEGQVSVPVFAYDRRTKRYGRRTDNELRQYADHAIDADAATVFMAGRAAVSAYRGRDEPAWHTFTDIGRQQAFDLAAKYHPAPFDQLLFVEAAYARALRILGTQTNRRGIQAIAQALMDGQRLAADDLGVILARARVRSRRRRT